MCHSCHSFCVVVVGGSDVGVVYIVAGVAVVAGGVVMVIFVVEADEKNVKAGKGRTVDFSFELTEAAKNDRVITLLPIVITILFKSACDKQFEVLWCFAKNESCFVFFV